MIIYSMPSNKNKSVVLQHFLQNGGYELKAFFQLRLGNNRIIGDQFFTDILFGVRAGYKTLLVDPLGEKDLRVTWFNRRIERIMKKRINFKDGEYYEESQTL